MKTSEKLENALRGGDEVDLDELLMEIKVLEDTANLWQCMKEAGIDNAEAYSYGYCLYAERYPKKDK